MSDLDAARVRAAEHLGEFARTQDAQHAAVLNGIALRLALSVARPHPDGTPSYAEIASREA